MGRDAEFIRTTACTRGIPFRYLDEARGLFTLQKGKKEFVFMDSLSPFSPAPSVMMGDDKLLTSAFLCRRRFSVPASQQIRSVKDAQRFLHSYKSAVKSVVVKPSDTDLGKGVTVDVTSSQELSQALAYARKFSNRILIEEKVTGRDIRVLIIDYKAVAVLEREPANVLGDGRSTIKQLILRRQTKLRRDDPRLSIPMDAETNRVLKKQGCTLSSRPSKETKVFVRFTANRHTGGVTIDRTKELPKFFKKIAEDIAKATRLPVLGVDFCIPDLKKKKYYVLEINPTPYLAFHTTPEIGKPVDTGKIFLDFFERRAKG